jgi:hypothetical protein
MPTEEGGFAFTLAATDTADTTATASQDYTLTVNDADLTDTSVAPNPQPTAIEGADTGSLVVATFTDANPGDNTADFMATIHWGDTTDSTGIVSFDSGTGTYSVGGTHVYTEESSTTPYKVTVDVTDIGGSTLSGIGQVLVTVNDAALADSSQPISPSPITEGTDISSVPLATFTDSNTGDHSGDFTATIHWGDGSPDSTGTVTFSSGTYTVTGSHSYDEGSFTPTVDIKDIGGSTLSGIGMTTFTLTDAALTDTSSTATQTITEGADISTVPLATFTDANPGDHTADFTATIHWNDGSPDSAGTVTFSGGTYTVTGSHSYDEGSFTPTVDITDAGGSTLSGIGMTTFTVTDAALTNTSSTAAYMGTAGTPTGSLLVATFTDGNPGNNTADFTVTIHWGDSTTSTGTVSYDSTSGTYSVNGSHTYTSANTYMITVDVSDDGGSSLTGIGNASIVVI